MALKKIKGASIVTLKYVGAALTGYVIAAVTILIVMLNGRQDLSVWHVADLDEEFDVFSDVESFADYLALEDRLFRQLDELVYDKVEDDPGIVVNRYSRGSLSDPSRWPVNWNRTFEMKPEDPYAGVLLLHGLSDSPYSLRSLGERLYENNAMVVGLRIPGHGTAPSGLAEIRWQDMAAAVRIAARHVSETLGDKPFFIVGYSNGGALAMEYVLDALHDTSLPRASGVVLLSPEIAITGAAAFAIWQSRIGWLFGLEKLQWNDLFPEYDPFKYNSFAVNAGDLAHRITKHIQSQLSSLQGSGKLADLPPILAFQSGVDATVSAAALVSNLFDRLPAGNHELVLFDINRRVELSGLLKSDPRAIFEPLLSRPNRPFELTVVTNEEKNSNQVVAHAANAMEIHASRSLPVGEWPAGVFSLSHVALPIPPTDSLYGGNPESESPGIELGRLAPRGERGVLWISGNAATRLRWNPFYDYVEGRIVHFMDLGQD